MSGTSTKEHQLYTQSQVRRTILSTVVVSLQLDGSIRVVGISSNQRFHSSFIRFYTKDLTFPSDFEGYSVWPVHSSSLCTHKYIFNIWSQACKTISGRRLNIYYFSHPDTLYARISSTTLIIRSIYDAAHLLTQSLPKLLLHC